MKKFKKIINTLLIGGFILTLILDFVVSPLTGISMPKDSWHYPLMSVTFMLLYLSEILR